MNASLQLLDGGGCGGVHLAVATLIQLVHALSWLQRGIQQMHVYI